MKRLNSTDPARDINSGTTSSASASTASLSGRKQRVKILERHVQKAILDYCHAMRIFVRRRNVGAIKTGSRYIRFNATGMADLWGITRKGRHWECEVKRPGEEPTEAQYRWLLDCQQVGAIAFWVDSLDGFIEKMQVEER